MTTLNDLDLVQRETTRRQAKIAIVCTLWIAALSVGLATWVPLMPTTQAIAPSPANSEPEPANAPAPAPAEQMASIQMEQQPTLGGGYFGPLRSD